MTFLTFITIVLSVESINLVNSKNLFEENDMGTVIFANVLFRHGDRTPIDPYPNDPYRNLSYWPVGFGQLTNLGKRQEYALGQWLRQRYNTLLTEDYNPDLVYVRSTDVDRTLMSAQLVLAGVFPPKGSQIWDPNDPGLRWQPIPVHTTEEKLDKVLAAKAPCPSYEAELERVKHSEEMKTLNKKYADVYKILNQYTGENVTSIEDIEYVYNTLFIEEMNNLTLPSWVKGIYPQPMDEASAYSFALPTWNPKLARLKTGLLVKNMISHMQDKIANKPSPVRNMWFYSAHDSTVASLLNTLRVFDVQSPPYSSVVLMELRVDANSNHHVTLYYRNSTTQEPYLLTLPGCTALCPLEQFIELCAPMIPNDWDSECQLSVFNVSSYSTLTIVALVVSVLLILLLVASGMLYWQRRKRPTHWYRKLKTDSL